LPKCKVGRVPEICKGYINGAEKAPALTEICHPTKRHLREIGRGGYLVPKRKTKVGNLAVLLVFQHRRLKDAKGAVQNFPSGIPKVAILNFGALCPFCHPQKQILHKSPKCDIYYCFEVKEISKFVTRNYSN
jgi:hypothetical protein